MIKDVSQVLEQKFKAILFDLDGVIVDSEPLHFKSWREALRPYRSSVLTWKDFLKHIYGRADTQVLQEFLPRRGSSEDKKVLAVKNQFFCSHLSEIPVMPSILKFLNAQQRYAVGLVSNALSVEVDHLLTFLKIQNTFKVIVTADQVQKPKPDPEPYQVAFKHLCTYQPLHPAEVLVIEDSQIGTQSAQSAGFKWVLQRAFGHSDIVTVIKNLT